ncbi:hypothetical protein PsorP6_010092 [Peronosclerospora sorghi]|uniref:Uncharacterized protein n=1 Tax=Peronosclerospora sorghi TaxID=230839 RepID=A0ACC0VZA5_9STRA|nr:hypothetical protein PsorP6_010092 [Peronosclerospora sorghi]
MIELLREWIRSSEGDSDELRESTSLLNTWTGQRAVDCAISKYLRRLKKIAIYQRRDYERNRWETEALTLGADDTIYEDGGSINKSSRILIRRGIVVSLLIAASFPGNSSRYEQRLRGILEALADLTCEERPRFLVVGRECNYRFETYTDTMWGIVGLREIDGAIWKDGRGEIINTSNKLILYENLEEISFTMQNELRHFQVPFCAFNGGNDVWVDIGHKALGIKALQKYAFQFLPKELRGSEMRNIQGHECLLVGDRFTITGNYTRSRDVAATVWVSNHHKTGCVMSILLQVIDLEHKQKRERNAEKEKKRENIGWKAEANSTYTTDPSDDESDNSFDTWAREC